MYNFRIISLGLLAALALAGGRSQAAEASQTIDLSGKSQEEGTAILVHAAAKVCKAEYLGAAPIASGVFAMCVKSTTQEAVTTYLAQSPFGKSSLRDSVRGVVMIQAVDVDTAEPWPDGQDRQEDQALPV